MRNRFSVSCSTCPLRVHLIGPLVTNQILVCIDAPLYLVPIKSYLKGTHGHLSLKWTLVNLVSRIYVPHLNFEKRQPSGQPEQTN